MCTVYCTDICKCVLYVCEVEIKSAYVNAYVSVFMWPVLILKPHWPAAQGGGPWQELLSKPSGRKQEEKDTQNLWRHCDSGGESE